MRTTASNGPLRPLDFAQDAAARPVKLDIRASRGISGSGTATVLTKLPRQFPCPARNTPVSIQSLRPETGPSSRALIKLFINVALSVRTEGPFGNCRTNFGIPL